MKISYLITCHNEDVRLLFYTINIHLRPQDEVIVIDDYSTDEYTIGVLNEYTQNGFKVLKHNLNNNYSEHKNFGNAQCTGDWIFQLDGDERPSENILGENLKTIIESNPDVELIYVPRINDFRGVTKDHAKQWGWSLSDSPTYNRPIVNFPDYQSRIYKNVPDRIKWERKLHEKIEGHNQYSFLPAEEDYALYHDKTIQTQIETNIRYNQTFTESENRGHKVV